MQNHFSYYYFKSAISPEDCQKIIDNGNLAIEDTKKRGKSAAATTFGNNHKQGFEKKGLSVPALGDKTHEDVKKELQSKEDENIESKSYVRDSEVAFFNDQWAYDLIWPYLTEANKKAGWNYDLDFAEDFQFTKYGLNQFYGWHADGGGCHFNTYQRLIPGVTPKNADGEYDTKYTRNHNLVGKIRKISMTINLNKPGEYQGGNLKFDYGPHAGGKRFHECEEIRPQGSIIFFPSYTYHQVTPVTKGTRYSLVLWICGKPFR